MMDYIFNSNIINFLIVASFLIWLLFFKIDVVKFFDKKSQETLEKEEKELQEEKEKIDKNL